MQIDVNRKQHHANDHIASATKNHKPLDTHRPYSLFFLVCQSRRKISLAKTANPTSHFSLTNSVSPKIKIYQSILRRQVAENSTSRISLRFLDVKRPLLLHSHQAATQIHVTICTTQRQRDVLAARIMYERCKFFGNRPLFACRTLNRASDRLAFAS